MKIVLIPTEPDEIERFRRAKAATRGNLKIVGARDDDLSITIERSNLGCLIAMPATDAEQPQRHQWGSMGDAICNMAAFQAELTCGLMQGVAHGVFNGRMQQLVEAQHNQQVLDRAGLGNGRGS